MVSSNMIHKFYIIVLLKYSSFLSVGEISGLCWDTFDLSTDVSICFSIFFDIFTLGYIRTTFSPKIFEASTCLLLKGFLKWWHIWACGGVSDLFLVRRISCIIMNLYYRKMVRSSWYWMFFLQKKNVLFAVKLCSPSVTLNKVFHIFLN